MLRGKHPIAGHWVSGLCFGVQFDSLGGAIGVQFCPP